MNKHNKKRLIIISIVILIILILMLVFGLIVGFDFSKLMGNSTVSTYYYCEDPTFTLKGNYCYKINYTEPMLIGDVNLDGNISLQDVIAIQKHSNGISKLDENALMVADVNGDGIVDSEDAVVLQKYISGIKIQSNTVGISAGISSTIGDKICPENYKMISSTSCTYKQVVKATKIEFIYGDLNSDKVINEEDSILLQEYLTGLIDLTSSQKKVADVNQDGIISMLDVTQLNKNIQKNNQDSVTATLTLLNDLDISSVDYNTSIDYQVKFSVNNSKKYYYKWFDVKKAGNTLESECKLITNNLSDQYTIQATDNNEYVLLKLYTDSSCTNQFNMYKSDEIKIKTEVSNVSLDYQLISPILTSNIVNKGTKLTFLSKFSTTGNKKYYYTWNAVKDGKIYNNPVCSLVTDGMTNNYTLTINGKDQYGTWKIYGDENCSDNYLIGSYSTDTYNYIADSISLDVKSTRLLTGNTLKLNVNIETNLNDVSNLVKWTSSNVAVATVDNYGNVSAKQVGTTTITATLGGISETSEITVVDVENDTSIACPMIEYDKSSDTMNFTITPSSDISKYDIYLSTNDHVGKYANYELIYQNITGVKSLNNYYNNAYSNQAKIVVYSNSGTSRNCYTPPLTWRWNTRSLIASCPTMHYSFAKNVYATSYQYKNGSQMVTSGMNMMYVGYKSNNDYQYSWYTLQNDGSYRLLKTYKTDNSKVISSVTGQLYNVNAQIVVTDKNGNNIVCKTDYINALDLIKTKVGTTDVYYEKTFPTADKDVVIDEMTKINNESSSYLAATKVFLYSEDSYLKIHGSSCGVYAPSTNNIDIRESTYHCGGAKSDWFRGTVKHEFGHSIDWMNERLSGTRLAFATYSGKTISDYTTKYENNKLCDNNYCLRYNGTNSYGTGYWEFVADLFAYDSKNFRMNDELLNLRKQMLSYYANNYNNSKSKFNELKESFR